MFLELLPGWTHIWLAYISAFIIVGGGAAIVIWYVKLARNYFDTKKSALDT